MVKTSSKQRQSLLQESSEISTPSFPIALFLLFASRALAARFSIISDCDETFNYWEPLHLLSYPSKDLTRSDPSFQTWENAPEFGIRSWAYLLQYRWVVELVKLLGGGKIKAFISVRLVLAFTSAFVEASLYRSVVEVLSPRVGRYLLVILITSAGMYTASTALLPSTFTMYTTTLAMSFAIYPSRLSSNYNLSSTWKGTKGFISSTTLPRTIPDRTFQATLIFALGALAGWPFSILLSIPFVFEELFLPSGDVNLLANSKFSLFISRLQGFIVSAISSASILLPILLSIDSVAYGKFTLVPLNIISYNLLSSERGVGPELYGTEPWYYYFSNLTLGFNFILPLAALSIPLVLVSWATSSSWINSLSSMKQVKDKKDQNPKDGSSPLLLLLVRLAPSYLWIALLSLQPHKEERFVFPAYPMLCLNAAVGLAASHSIIEKLWRTISKQSGTSSNQSTSLPTSIGFIFPSFLILTSLISASRILALSTYYKAPIQVLKDLNNLEKSNPTKSSSTICYGQEWYRFPSHFLLPQNFRTEFVRSDFDGILPAHFGWERELNSENKVGRKSYLIENLDLISEKFGLGWSRKEETRALGGKFNELNREEVDRYVPLSSCDYLVHLSFPAREPDSQSPAPPTFTPVSCHHFLDSSSSRPTTASTRIGKIKSTLARILWLPGGSWKKQNQWGDFCLLKKKGLTGILENE